MDETALLRATGIATPRDMSGPVETATGEPLDVVANRTARPGWCQPGWPSVTARGWQPSA